MLRKYNVTSKDGGCLEFSSTKHEAIIADHATGVDWLWTASTSL